MQTSDLQVEKRASGRKRLYLRKLLIVFDGKIKADSRQKNSFRKVYKLLNEKSGKITRFHRKGIADN